MKKKISVIFGTRPEAIKLAPVILELRKQQIPVQIVHTGQHNELVEPILKTFGIDPGHRLEMMSPGQTPLELLQKLLAVLPDMIHSKNTSTVLVQGDTTTALAGALAAHHQKITVAHLEAGLRSHDRSQPFPEETNRTLISHLSDLNFAPTAGARQNLIAEGISDDTIHVTGNSVVDALHYIIRKGNISPDELRKKHLKNGGHLILLTTHRRENFGEPLTEIFSAVKELATRFTSSVFLFPVHPNPKVQDKLTILKSVSNIKLLQPLAYEEFVPLMAAADLILTDSGGIQEEAPALGTPVFVLRNKTERPELLESGAGKLIGTTKERIIEEVASHFRSHKPSETRELFGDGHTAERVVRLLNR